MKLNANSLLVGSLALASTFAMPPMADAEQPSGLGQVRVTDRPVVDSSQGPMLLAYCGRMTYNGIGYPSMEAMYRARAADARQARTEQSAQVRSDQQSLQGLGYYRGDVDGLMGPGTMSAIREFRAANSLGTGTTLDANCRQLIQSGKAVSKGSTTSAGKAGSTLNNQQALADLGYYKGPVDGKSGPMTRSAIQQFKAKNGLDGKNATIDAATQIKLAEAHAALPSR
jgi:peptidoglycan hydrolase-like protein with peptidoglycan-binding domain